MTTEALIRFNEHGWIARKLVNFIEETYGQVEHAMESITPDSLSIVFISNLTLVTVSTPIGNAAVIELESQEYPLRQVAKLSVQHEPIDLDPDDAIDLERARLAFKVTLLSGEEVAFDFKDVTRPVAAKTKDSRELLGKIRSIIQSF